MTATPVAPVSVSSPWLCAAPGCEAAATWQVGDERRSCTRDVGIVLAELYAAEPRPFAPFLPVPLKRGNW